MCCVTRPQLYIDLSLLPFVQFGLVSAQDVHICGPFLAVLAVIGGIDLRPRLGGLVQHDEFGVGTIALVKKKQVKVLFEDHRTPKLCPVSQLKPVRY